jgi:hypothetical protein
VRHVLRQKAMAFPSGDTTGPSIEAGSLNDEGRAALASVYCALRTERLLESLATAGDVVIEGPLSGNALFCDILAALRPASRILVSVSPIGSGLAGTILAAPQAAHRPRYRHVPPLDVDGLVQYRADWRARLGS